VAFLLSKCSGTGTPLIKPINTIVLNINVYCAVVPLLIGDTIRITLGYATMVLEKKLDYSVRVVLNFLFKTFSQWAL
jgi:hypothetical protein